MHLTDDHPMACLSPDLPSLPSLCVLHVADLGDRLLRAGIRFGFGVALLVALPGVLS